MAEQEQAQEKTEQPSPKRLKEAREKGQVARSKDFNATLILLFAGGGFLIFGRYLATQLTTMMRQAFEFDSTLLTSTKGTFQSCYLVVKTGFIAVLPLLLVILLLSIAAPLLMGGWVFSSESLQPKLSRLSPLKGLKRMVSLKGFVEMVKALAKFILVALVAIGVLKWQVPALMALASYPLPSALSEGVGMVGVAFLVISASLIVIAALDVPFQWHEHNKQLKMTKQEMKDEYKETEGKPEVKSQIRRTQQEIARRRMMSEVPKADVVLTNPTHYAVAITYKQHGSRAPVVIAKGQDLIALQINRVAKASDVPILSLPPLARALYYSTDLNEEIPRGLYVAVAQVLAYIFQLHDKTGYEVSPGMLRDLPIPDDLKRDGEEQA
ncbi:flagellar biosynthesis protein FlhB [Legionella spiritensis]|uniref:Flagellar biosynthetic protein FlhB n=1 Tax=Legionella spiritensis TaxID=452 RepID=A0A0W0Z9A4_LEGSP|nr:flagellar biosynthesis protein FlhB [Legionella spiritensis]KTD65676.1 flagellar biosynthetic protein FlhB [Legionella spiritensis]SNV43587.1 flagellar biosynthetic protein FlhB [Legionella spiritensis]VEG90665.1 flagellar biosynthetic protein FlhB [Legionella spiritensis]